MLQGLKQALWASGPEYVATSLMRLQAHYWRPDFTEAQARELYVDFIEDLGELPPDILDEAIRQYRRDPEARFFPRPGDLLATAKPLLEERRRAVSRLERGPDHKPAHPSRSPEEIARVRALVKGTFPRPDDAA